MSAKICRVVARNEAYQDVGRKPSDRREIIDGRRTRRATPDVRDTGMRVPITDVFRLFVRRRFVRAARRQTVVQLADSKRRRADGRRFAAVVR